MRRIGKMGGLGVIMEKVKKIIADNQNNVVTAIQLVLCVVLGIYAFKSGVKKSEKKKK